MTFSYIRLKCSSKGKLKFNHYAQYPAILSRALMHFFLDNLSRNSCISAVHHTSTARGDGGKVEFGGVSRTWVFISSLLHPCTILSTRFYRENRSSIRPICSVWRIENFLDAPTSKVFYPTIHLISENDHACKFVNSADSFYSANGKCYLRADK